MAMMTRLRCCCARSWSSRTAFCLRGWPSKLRKICVITVERSDRLDLASRQLIKIVVEVEV